MATVLKLTDSLLALDKVKDDSNYTITAEDWVTAMDSIKTVVNNNRTLVEQATAKTFLISPDSTAKFHWERVPNNFSRNSTYRIEIPLSALNKPNAVSCMFFDSDSNSLQLQYAFVKKGSLRNLKVECNKNIPVYAVLY